MGDHIELLSELPDGTLRFDVLNAQVSHSSAGPLKLQVAGELAAWFNHRLKELNIDSAAILGAEWWRLSLPID